MWAALLWTGLLACNSPDGAKHWIQWEQAELPGDAAGLRIETYCGEKMYSAGHLYDAEGQGWEIPGGVPANPVTGEVGPVSCLGETLFTSPPGTLKGYRSVDGGPFEEMVVGEDSYVASVRVSASQDAVYRSLYYSDANLPALIQISEDLGESWETTSVRPTNPAGGDVETVLLTHTEGFLEFAVLDSTLEGGSQRSSFDGETTFLTVNGFNSDLESPTPAFVRDGLTLSADAFTWAKDLPSYGLQHFFFTDQDPLHTTSYDYEPILHAGLFFWGVPAANDMYRVIQDGDGHLWVRTDGVAYRSTHPWTASAREAVIQDRDCERLEWSAEKFGDKERDDGPGQVTFTHSGGEGVMLAVLEDNEPVWQNEQVLEDGQYRYQLLEEGEEITLASDAYPLLVMSQSGVCLEVLTAGEDTEVDVGALQ